MSSPFSKLDMITQSQYKEEIATPSLPFCGPTPHYLCPKVSDVADDDPDFVQTIPDLTKKQSSTDWLSRRTKKKLSVDQLRIKIEKMEE